MTKEEEIKRFAKAARAYGKKVASSKEDSLAFLIRVGVLPKGTTLQDIANKKF
jgi:hypothetical protein